MDAKNPSKPNDETQAILALAVDLRNQLTNNDGPDILTWTTETVDLLDKTLDRLPLLADATPSSIRRQLDNEGTKLWNIRGQRMRTAQNGHDIVQLCKVQALAYVMLEAAAPMTGPGNHRCLELSFKVVKTCIEHKLIDLSQRLMETAALRLDLIERSKPETDRDKLELFKTHYYMLRVYLACSQGRSDIADHLFSKLPEAKTAEQQRIIVDLCYTIGDAALTAGQYDIATVWLDRALTVCKLWANDGTLGQSWKDKRMLVLHAYARSNLHLTTADSEYQLRKALNLLRMEYGSSFPVLVFSLEVLNRKDTLDEEYFETLKSSIKEIGNDDASVRIVYHYVTRLGSLSLELFVEACGQLLNKLADLELSTKEQWMEKIFVSVIWTVTNTNSITDHDPKLAETATRMLVDCGLHKPSEDATQASLLLIWKYIDTMLSKGSRAIAEQWCRLILKQPMFQKTSDTEAKAFRKLILCVLGNYNPSTAAQLFADLSDDYKTCPLTLYLMYRLALLGDDASRATGYIQSLCELGTDATYVWSCLADALHLGRLDNAIRNLEDVIAVSDDDGFERLRISELLQFMICTVCEKKNATSNECFLERTTSLLESALTVATREQRKPLSSVELRWLSCKSYSIALGMYKQPLLDAVIGLLNISIKFMELYQKESGAGSNIDPLEHLLKCTFLQTMIIITEARRETSSRKKESHYEKAREVIKHFHDHIQAFGLDTIAKSHPDTWLDKYRIILSFDFEAAVFLHQWEDLTSIIEASKPIVCAKLSSVFLDCLLRSGAPSSHLSRFLKQLIRTFHSSPSPFLDTPAQSFSEYLPRHLRCLFSLSLQAEEYILAESVLDQAFNLARNGADNSFSQSPYPAEELQWIATTAFNRAVEFFLVSADGDCQRWAGKAIALADLIGEDKGKLGRLLRANRAKLRK
ncbi:meiosis protein SPO22/ZIP4 like-domain-containing protein [Aspergillus crustosus]